MRKFKIAFRIAVEWALVIAVYILERTGQREEGGRR